MGAMDISLLRRLLAENKTLNLAAFDFRHRERCATLSLDGEPIAGAHRDLLMTAQRIHRVAQGDARLRDTILEAGYASAHQIARDPVRFVADMTAPVGAQAAQEALAKAQHLRASATHLAAHIRSMVGSPHFRNSRFSLLSTAARAELEDMDGFAELFGNLDYMGCEDCQSIYSPAAYLVDLLRICVTYLSDKGDDLLKRRRPDLCGIELSCENTNTVIPYLSVVNPLLVGAIAPPGSGLDGYQLMAEAVFPFSVPYHHPLTQIRTSLTALNSSYERLIGTFGPDSSVDGIHEIAIEQLGLSQKSASMITTQGQSFGDIMSLYGITAQAASGTVTIGQQPTLDNDPACAVVGTGTLFGTEIVEGDMIAVAGQARIVTAIADPLNATVGQAWTLPLSDQTFSVATPRTIARVASFLAATGLSYAQLDALLNQDLDPALPTDQRTLLAGAFFINNTGETLPPIASVWQTDSNNNSYQVLTNLSLARLDRLARFIRLW